MMEKLFSSYKQKRRSMTISGRSLSPGNKNSSSQHTPKHGPKTPPVAPAKLAIDYESPPLVFHGSLTRSTGAILSGQLELIVLEAQAKITAFKMVLVGKVLTKKPVAKDCPDCTSITTVLQKWIFLNEPVRFKQGKYSFPFSYLLPGHLPATSNSALGSIEYELQAHAILNLDEPIHFSRILTVQRATHPGIDRSTTRVFPPTNIVTTATIPTTIHSIGEFSVYLRLSGLVTKNLTEPTHTRLRVRKILWRIEELARIVSPACPKHEAKLVTSAIGIPHHGRGILHESKRKLAEQSFKRGWKSSPDSDTTEFETSIAIDLSTRPVCDVHSPTGFVVDHRLVLEIIVAEELLTGSRGQHASYTGLARVLRMTFPVVLTERGGLGVSWDEEQPPVYQDVPGSPPGYARIEEYVGDPIPYEELEAIEGADGGFSEG